MSSRVSLTHGCRNQRHQPKDYLLSPHQPPRPLSAFTANRRETVKVANGTAEETGRIAGLKIRSALFRVRLSAPHPPGAAFKEQLLQVADLKSLRKARACCNHIAVYAFAFLMHVTNNLGVAVEFCLACINRGGIVACVRRPVNVFGMLAAASFYFRLVFLNHYRHWAATGRRGTVPVAKWGGSASDSSCH